ncbi:MAG: hypothetical protein R2844_00985 [Caldilineales bacterium]
MLTVGTAQELRNAGLQWTPAALDLFTVPLPELENQIFVISEMTILAENLHGHPALTFHGSVEWALDHVWTGDALWIPREDQLRSLIEELLASKAEQWRLILESDDAGYRCTVETGDRRRSFQARDASECLAAALLQLLSSE